ncbi:MAG: methyl-accepting chemotaxis protein, partial [Polaromonas sp.]|nr:methyl-accepting chemotaxis protein [Polaromonas sp.]
MSVIEKIQKLFKTKQAPPEDSMDGVSLDMSVDPLATGALDVQVNPVSAMSSTQTDVGDDPETQSPDETPDDVELLSLPLLGRRPMGQHQRVLVILMAFSVIVLGAV